MKLPLEILALESNGAKRIELSATDSNMRFVTRRDGGIDVTIFGSDLGDGSVIQVKFDSAALVHALAECLSKVDFQPETYDVISNMTRGDIKADSNGNHLYVLQSEEIRNKGEIANYDKWCRENEYLNFLGSFIEALRDGLGKARVAYERKFSRSMSRIRTSRSWW